MLQDDDYKALQDIVRNYSVKDVLSALYKIYEQEADDFADVGYKEKSAVFADVSEELKDLHDDCHPSW